MLKKEVSVLPLYIPVVQSILCGYSLLFLGAGKIASRSYYWQNRPRNPDPILPLQPLHGKIGAAAKNCPNVIFFGIMNSENMLNHSYTKNFGKF